MIVLAMRTAPGMNVREHFRVRAKRVKAERAQTALALLGREKPALPCTVLLTRVAPSEGLDDDNLAGALKGVRDQVAQWLGVDDRKATVVAYRYAQTRGPWSVRIDFGQPASGAQLVLGVPQIAT